MITQIKLGSTIFKQFSLTNASGNAATADVMPSALIYENSATTALAYTPTVTTGADLGTYIMTLEATSSNGFSVHNSYNVVVSAAVNSVTGRKPYSFYTVSAYSDDASSITTGDVTGALNSYGAATCGYVSGQTSTLATCAYVSGEIYDIEYINEVNTIIDRYKMPVNNIRRLMYVDYDLGVDTGTTALSAGTKVSPYKTLQYALDQAFLYQIDLGSLVSDTSYTTCIILQTPSSEAAHVITAGYDNINFMNLAIVGEKSNIGFGARSFANSVVPKIYLSNDISASWFLEGSNIFISDIMFASDNTSSFTEHAFYTWGHSIYRNINFVTPIINSATSSYLYWIKIDDTASMEITNIHTSSFTPIACGANSHYIKINSATYNIVNQDTTNISVPIFYFDNCSTIEYTNCKIDHRANALGASNYSTTGAYFNNCYNVFIDCPALPYPDLTADNGSGVVTHYGIASSASTINFKQNYIVDILPSNIKSDTSAISDTVSSALSSYGVAYNSATSAQAAIGAASALTARGIATCAYVSANAGSTPASALTGATLSALTAYGAATCAYVSANAASTPASALTGATLSALTAYGAATCAYVSANAGSANSAAAYTALTAYGAATCAYVSANAGSTPASALTGAAMSALSSYGAATCGYVGGLVQPVSALSANTLSALSSYGAATCAYVSANAASTPASALTGAALSALSSYGVAYNSATSAQAAIGAASALTARGIATCAYVSGLTAPLATCAYVSGLTNELVTNAYLSAQLEPLATCAYVSGVSAQLATTTQLNDAMVPLATCAYVSGLTAPLATCAYVSGLTLPLATCAYVSANAGSANSAAAYTALTAYNPLRASAASAQAAIGAASALTARAIATCAYVSGQRLTGVNNITGYFGTYGVAYNSATSSQAAIGAASALTARGIATCGYVSANAGSANSAAAFVALTAYGAATCGYVSGQTAPLATCAYVSGVSAQLATTTQLNDAMVPLATCAYVSGQTAPLATCAYVSGLTAPLATCAYVSGQTAPLATCGYVSGVSAQLATTTQLTAAVAPLATCAYVSGRTAPLATCAYVSGLTAPLATCAYVSGLTAPLATCAQVSAATNTILNEFDNLTINSRIITDLPASIVRASESIGDGNKWFAVNVLLYDTSGASFDPYDYDGGAYTSTCAIYNLNDIVYPSYADPQVSEFYKLTSSVCATTGIEEPSWTAGSGTTAADVCGNIWTNIGTTADLLAGHRQYNGLGVICKDNLGNNFDLYQTCAGAQLTTLVQCKHLTETAVPQILPRSAKGYYRFWINASSATPLGSLSFFLSWFDKARWMYDYTINDHNFELKYMIVDSEFSVSAIQTVTDKIATMLEADGLNFKYTTGALQNAPTTIDTADITGALSDYGAATCAYVSANSTSSGAIIDALGQYGAATCGYVSGQTCGLATCAYVSGQTSPLATTTQLNNAMVPLATCAYVSGQTAPLATCAYVSGQTAPLATCAYVSGLTAPLATCAYVSGQTAPLATCGYVAAQVAPLATCAYMSGLTAPLATCAFVTSDNDRVTGYINDKELATCAYVSATVAGDITVPASSITGALDIYGVAQTSSVSSETVKGLNDYGAATCAYVSANSTSSGAILDSLGAYGVPTCAYVSGLTAPLATCAYMSGLTAPLATCAYLSGQLLPLATTTQLNAAVAPLATCAYVSGRTAPLATCAYVSANATQQNIVTAAMFNYGVAQISAISGESLNALYQYGAALSSQFNTLAQDIASGITGVSAVIQDDQIDFIINQIVISSVPAVTGAIATYGDQRWSKIYGIPVSEWDIIVGGGSQ